MADEPAVAWRLSTQTNVGRAINTAAQRLTEAGIDSSRLDAQVILAHALGVERSWLFAHFEHELTASQADHFTKLIARRSAHEPVAYLVGHKEFYGLDLWVDRSVLIPRPETEMLVDAVLDVVAVKAAPQPLAIADVGTGAGAIALAVAANAPDAQLYAIDVSAAALAVARNNTARLDRRRQVTLLHGDLLAPLPLAVDIVVANLPYVTSEDYGRLDADVRSYEPRLALEAGAQGLDVITRLLHQLPLRLKAGGVVILEIGYNQGEQVLTLIRQLTPATAIELSQDYQGHDRMVTFTLK